MGGGRALGEGGTCRGGVAAETGEGGAANCWAWAAGVTWEGGAATCWAWVAAGTWEGGAATCWAWVEGGTWEGGEGSCPCPAGGGGRWRGGRGRAFRRARRGTAGTRYHPPPTPPRAGLGQRRWVTPPSPRQDMHACMPRTRGVGGGGRFRWVAPASSSSRSSRGGGKGTAAPPDARRKLLRSLLWAAGTQGSVQAPLPPCTTCLRWTTNCGGGGGGGGGGGQRDRSQRAMAPRPRVAPAARCPPLPPAQPWRQVDPHRSRMYGWRSPQPATATLTQPQR